MKFISAGHCTQPGPNFDPGAPSTTVKGATVRWEANETVRVRNRVIQILRCRGFTDIKQDADAESLQQYLNRIVPGSGSVVEEFHFNAGPPGATGTEALVEVDADANDKAFAAESAEGTSRILGIKNRGVKSEASTRHKRLALMKETGIIVLMEICFITNPKDMAAFDKNFEPLCQFYADLLVKYDRIIS